MAKPQRHLAPMWRARVDQDMQVVDRRQLRRSRLARRWSQCELAALVGCSQTLITRLERGTKVGISERLAMRLAKELDFDWKVVFGDWPPFSVSTNENRPRTPVDPRAHSDHELNVS